MASFWIRDQTCVLCFRRSILNHWTTRGVQYIYLSIIYLFSLFFFLLVMQCGLQDLSCLTRNEIHVPWGGSSESHPPDCQGIPSFSLFLRFLHNLRKMGKKEAGPVSAAAFFLEAGGFGMILNTFLNFFMLVLLAVPSLYTQWGQTNWNLRVWSRERFITGPWRERGISAPTLKCLKNFSKAFFKLVFIRG